MNKAIAEGGLRSEKSVHKQRRKPGDLPNVKMSPRQPHVKRTIDEISSLIARQGLIVFAGAGVSMEPPSRVPGWFALNGMLVEALKHRVTSYLDQDAAWLDQVIRGLIGHRDEGRFPPDYQAQIMEEQCRETYFAALTHLDVCQGNRIHADLAALAGSHILKGIVTTNFDRLIELAFDRVELPYESFIKEEDFRQLSSTQEISLDKRPATPVLKIHGSVESADSMVDTLRQRLRGRKELLDGLIANWFRGSFVLYAGFSGADLNHDSGYLGLCKSAEASAGALFVQFPGSKLEPGAQALLDAYGDRGHLCEATLDEVFSCLFVALDLPRPDEPPIVDSDPKATVATKLEAWADSLQPYEAINVLTALLDAGGEEDAAFHILHKTWKSRLPADSEGEHYARYQYNYASHCMRSGEMQYEETPQNFLRGRDVVAQSGAGFALWNLYRARVDHFWPFLMEAKSRQLESLDPRVEGDLMLVFARAAVIYRWLESLSEVVEAGNLQRQEGDIPRAVRLWTAAAHLAARSDNPQLAFDLFDHCEWWVKYLGDDTLCADLYFAQAIANLTQGSAGSARWNLDRAVPVFRKYQAWPSLIESLIEAFRCDIAEGRAEDAVKLVDEASQRIAKGYEIYYPHLGIAVAEYHLGVDQMERARRELVKCRPFAEASRNEWALSTIDSYLKRIAERARGRG